jgi:metal-responsive CopG/Arc/MetJ family transcriptional regulator
MKKRVTISLNEEILKEIDQIRTYVPRSAYINHILVVFLKIKAGNAHEFNSFFQK